MSRRLNTTLMVGTTIYPAGTREADIDGVVTAKGVWDVTDADDSSESSADTAELMKAFDKVRAQRDDARAKLEAAGAERDQLAEQLEAVAVARDQLAERLTAVTAERDQLAAASGSGSGDGSGPYADLDVDALKTEIDRRNEGRPDDAKISKRGGKDTLLGFLVADDEAGGA